MKEFVEKFSPGKIQFKSRNSTATLHIIDLLTQTVGTYTVEREMTIFQDRDLHVQIR